MHEDETTKKKDKRYILREKEKGRSTW